MFSTSLVPLALAFLALLQPALTLGINCRGSGVCPLAGFENGGSSTVMQGLRDAMYSVSNTIVPGSTVYADGDHIICVSSSIDISISIGVSAHGASGKIGLNGALGIGGVCAFSQNTNGAGITLDRARQAMDDLLKHGCKVCGSDPLQPGNNVKSGQLTVNYVRNPSCTGNCLGAGAGLNPTAGQDQTSSAAGASPVVTTSGPAVSDISSTAAAATSSNVISSSSAPAAESNTTEVATSSADPGSAETTAAESDTTAVATSSVESDSAETTAAESDTTAVATSSVESDSAETTADAYEPDTSSISDFTSEQFTTAPFAAPIYLKSATLSTRTRTRTRTRTKHATAAATSEASTDGSSEE